MKIELTKNVVVIRCPKCGNNTNFKAYSTQISEDCCEVYVVCDCGFDPTDMVFGSRYEDTWGGTSHANIMVALDCWNDAILEHKFGNG